jgi:hypothetical protein
MQFAQQRPAHWTPLGKSARWLGWIEPSSSGWSRNIQVTMRLECISPPHPRHPGAKQHTWTSRQPSVPSLPPVSRCDRRILPYRAVSALLGPWFGLVLYLGTVSGLQEAPRLLAHVSNSTNPSSCPNDRPMAPRSRRACRLSSDCPACQTCPQRLSSWEF